MYKRLPALGAALVWAALLAGCGGGSAGAGVVSANGSTSLEQVMGILMESYREICPEVTVNYTGSGSGAGIAGVIAGTCDLGLSSRPLKEQELAQGIRAHLLALDGLAVVVHPNNPAEDLALEEIARIFRGEVSTWAELGWEDRPVAVIGREAGSGTRGAFESIVGVEGRCAYTNELTSTGDVLANVASNPNAIGYLSLPAVNGGVKAVTVDGVAPGEETVRDGSYPLQRPFLLVTPADAPLSPAAQGFLDYALGTDAAELIRRAGAVPPAREDSAL